MGQLVPELADDEQIYMDLEQALAALHADGDDRIDLVFQVHRPKHMTAQTRAAINQPQRYRMIPLQDRRFEATMANGEKVYEFLEIPLIRGMSGAGLSLPTVCTNGLLVDAPTKIPASVRSKLQGVLDFDWMRIYPEESF
jgi:hypothetical protein